jgi:hypothetical protein
MEEGTMEGEEGDILADAPIATAPNTGIAINTVGGTLGLSNLGLAIAAVAVNMDAITVATTLANGGPRALGQLIGVNFENLSAPHKGTR